MSVLYRKYRPEKFDDVVGQANVTEALNGVIGEAYANPYGEGRIVAVEAAP